MSTLEPGNSHIYTSTPLDCPTVTTPLDRPTLCHFCYCDMWVDMYDIYNTELTAGSGRRRRRSLMPLSEGASSQSYVLQTADSVASLALLPNEHGNVSTSACLSVCLCAMLL